MYYFYSTIIKEKAGQKQGYQSNNPFLSVPIQSPSLLELLNQAMQEAITPQGRYGKTHDLKTYAKAVNFLQEHNITTLVQLQESVSKMKKRYWNTNGQIKHTERLLHEHKELIEYAEKYQKYRPFQQTYVQMNPRKQEAYYEKFRAELTLYEAAERYLKKTLGSNTTLKPKIWTAEAHTLSTEKDRLYTEIQTLKTKVQEAEAVKKCVEQAVQQPEQKRQKSKDITL